MKKTLLITILSILIYSCKENGENSSKNVESVVSKPRIPTSDSIQKVINNNDTTTYKELARFYIINNSGDDFFFYAMKMAYKNNYSVAYYDIYFIMALSIRKEPRDAVNLMDAKSKNFALYHLLKSYEMGYHRARFEIAAIFGQTENIPSSHLYLNELCKQYDQ